MKFLIVGCGSIGKRHLHNLVDLGYQDIHVVDPQKPVLNQVKSEFDVTIHSSLEAAVEIAPNISILANPTSFHVPAALELAKCGTHLFIEKPLSHSMEGVGELLAIVDEKKLVAMVAYSLRFFHGIRLLREMLQKGEIGKPLYVHAEAGQYLPDWRPGTNYRAQYSAQAEQGGGVILDLSHELDYLLWLFGPVQFVSAVKARVSDLDINVEDSADILLEHENGVISNVHLDYLQRFPARSCKIVGAEGTLIWNNAENSVRLFKAQSNAWENHIYSTDRNEMYIREMKHFIKCVQQKDNPLISLKDGARVLQLIHSAMQAADSGQRQKVNYAI